MTLKKILIVLIGLFVARVAFAAAVPDYSEYLLHDGLKRRFLVHLPEGYDGKKAVPLVLNFHGGLSKPETQRKQTQMNVTADKYGFIVVYPEGLKGTWNAGDCCGYAEWKNIDDVGFVLDMVATLERTYKVDHKRIYATGISNGGMFAYRLACELSDRIAAVGVVSGGMGVEGPTPKRPVPVIHIHGLKDQNYPFNGGIGPSSLSKVSFPPIADTINWWLSVNHCVLTPEVKREKEYVMERYSRAPGQAGAPVVLYKLIEGGHTWPGGMDVTKGWGTGKLISSFNASEVIWQFFSQQVLP